MCQRLCALLLLCCFSLSSLPAEPLPDISTNQEQQAQSEQPEKTLTELLNDFEVKLNTLTIAWEIVTKSSPVSEEILNRFAEKLLASEQYIKNLEISNAELTKQSTQDRKRYEELLKTLQSLKEDLAKERAASDKEKIKTIAISAGVGLAVGVLAGLALGIGLSR